MRLLDHPTVPPSASPDSADSGERWPRVFCAFQGCPWLQPLCGHMLLGAAPDAVISVYRQAVAVKFRGCAPIAGTSFDRIALADFADAAGGNRVAALVCFCCGGIHPYVEEVADKGPIQCYKPLRRNEAQDEFEFLGQPMPAIERLLGLQLYLARYNLVKPLRPEATLTNHESFDDW